MLQVGDVFKFKQFEISHDKVSMKVNTDGILLGAWTDVIHKKRALDIGTGTGIIAIMIAQRNEHIHSSGIDIDAVSAEQAASNMKHSPFAPRLESFHISIQDYSVQAPEKFDLIVSNPPFFSGGTFSNNENKNNVRHTVKLPHQDLLRSVRHLITTDGHFDLILPYIEGLRFIEMAAQYDLYLTRSFDVIPRPQKPIERLLLSFTTNQAQPILHGSLTVYRDEKGNEYSDEFIALTKEFYLHM